MVETMTDYAREREAMVERQLKRRGITERHILDAFLAVPREAFIGGEFAHLAYGDHPLPIEAQQTISQPYIVALMIQAASIKPGDKVLEVGAGSGYAAAVMSRMADKVYAIELLSHYFQAELSRQFDAWIWFAETEAVAARALHAHGPDETYPFGL
jgi:protein-L-isoaspartate(D-aspartate) O-methyltransferase